MLQEIPSGDLAATRSCKENYSMNDEQKILVALFWKSVRDVRLTRAMRRKALAETDEAGQPLLLVNR